MATKRVKFSNSRSTGHRVYLAHREDENFKCSSTQSINWPGVRIGPARARLQKTPHSGLRLRLRSDLERMFQVHRHSRVEMEQMQKREIAVYMAHKTNEIFEQQLWELKFHLFFWTPSIFLTRRKDENFISRQFPAESARTVIVCKNQPGLFGPRKDVRGAKTLQGLFADLVNPPRCARPEEKMRISNAFRPSTQSQQYNSSRFWTKSGLFCVDFWDKWWNGRNEKMTFQKNANKPYFDVNKNRPGLFRRQNNPGVKRSRTVFRPIQMSQRSRFNPVQFCTDSPRELVDPFYLSPSILPRKIHFRNGAKSWKYACTYILSLACRRQLNVLETWRYVGRRGNAGFPGCCRNVKGTS